MSMLMYVDGGRFWMVMIFFCCVLLRGLGAHSWFHRGLKPCGFHEAGRHPALTMKASTSVRSKEKLDSQKLLVVFVKDVHVAAGPMQQSFDCKGKGLADLPH